MTNHDRTLPEGGRVQLVSVIVTTRNSERTLEACLASVRRQSHPAVELVLVDNSSTDDTLQIAQRHCDIVATKGPERSAQRNYAAELSHGDILFFVDSDMVLEEEVVAQGAAQLAETSAKGVIVPEMSFGEGFWTHCRIHERQCYMGDDSVEAARMYRRSDFMDAGGFDLELKGAEDWDLSRRIGRGRRYPRTAAIIHHDEGRTTLRSSFVKRRYYAPGYLRYARKHRGAVGAQANPVLRAAFLHHWRTLLRHPALTTGIFTLKVLELVAVLQVAAESLAGGPPDRKDQMYAALGSGDAQPRPAMLTFGSVRLADGGVQTRARLTAEVFERMGLPLAIVSTREPDAEGAPSWAASLLVPRRKPKKAFSPALVRLIGAQCAGSTCLIFENAMFMPAIAAARVRQPLIWDTNECQTLHYRRLGPTPANAIKFVCWFVLERWASRRCDVAVAISDVEAGSWRRTHPPLADKLAVVDHVALASPRDPRAARGEVEALLGQALQGPLLLFLGTLGAKHNAVAAAWIVDELAGRLPPGVQVVLCGPGTDELVRRSSHKLQNVTGLGVVDDVDTVVAAADLCLAPLATGAGVKTKVLHYLAHGKPVIGTPTAFEGLAGAPGLYDAPLNALPDLVLNWCSQPESIDAARSRAQAQLSWIAAYHSRQLVEEQWKRVLECLPTL